MPPAPPTFSTTTVVPRLSPIRGDSTRASTSLPLPAANGTTSVTGRFGQSCAAAGSAAATSNAAAATSLTILIASSCSTIAARLHLRKQRRGRPAIHLKTVRLLIGAERRAGEHAGLAVD